MPKRNVSVTSPDAVHLDLHCMYPSDTKRRSNNRKYEIGQNSVWHSASHNRPQQTTRNFIQARMSDLVSPLQTCVSSWIQTTTVLIRVTVSDRTASPRIVFINVHYDISIIIASVVVLLR